MSKAALFLLIFSLAACHHGVRSDAAVRQGVLDYLAGPMGLSLNAMDVKLDSATFDGDKAKAAVTISLKGNSAPMMTKTYELQQKDGKWVVTGRSDAAGHGGMTTLPPSHPAIAPGAGAGAAMPAPEDLPPAGKKE